jgi:hypothetical protein
MSTTFNFHENLTRIMGILHGDPWTVMIISRSVIIIMRNFSDKIFSENQNKYFKFNNVFLKVM